MPLTNFTELKVAISDWLNRADLNAVIPTFIALTEAEFNRTLRVRDMLARTTVPLTGQFTPLPFGFLEFKKLQLNDAVAGQVTELTNVGSPEELDRQRRLYYSTPGIPAIYCIRGGEFEVAPTPAATYSAEWSYYAVIPALGVAAPSNWLLAKHPDLYVYGALLHSAPYLKDDERVQLWMSAYRSVYSSIKGEEDRVMLGGSAPKTRVRPID